MKTKCLLFITPECSLSLYPTSLRASRGSFFTIRTVCGFICKTMSHMLVPIKMYSFSRQRKCKDHLAFTPSMKARGRHMTPAVECHVK